MSGVSRQCMLSGDKRFHERKVMYTAVEGARVPIRMWADPTSVEDQAMRQLHNVANLPWVPDCTIYTR